MLIPLVLIPLTGTILVLDFTGLDTFKVLYLVCDELHLHDSSGYHLAKSISSSFQLSTYLSLACTNFRYPRISTCHPSLLLLASTSTYLTPTHFDIHIREPLPNSTLAHFSVHLPQLLLFLGSSERHYLESTSEFHHGRKINLKTHNSTPAGDSCNRAHPSASTGLDHERNGEMESSSSL